MSQSTPEHARTRSGADTRRAAGFTDPNLEVGSESSEAPAPARTWFELFCRHVPALETARGYTARILFADLVAGLTVATVAVPQAMAYALIAGMPPQYGLYTAIVMTLVGALLDSSRQLINGPTNAISIAVLSAVAPFAARAAAPEDTVSAVILLAFLMGLVQTGITLLRLGDLTRFISNAVIVGFTVGAAVLLVLDQLKNLLGMEVPAALKLDPHAHFLKRFWLTLANGPVHLPTVAIGLGTILMVLALRWLAARWRLQRLPDFLLTVIVMAFLTWLFDLEQRGVAVVGEVPARLPALQLPRFNWEMIRELANSALAIALLGLLEAIAMAKAIAAVTKQKLDINQQCLSEGLANLVGSFFQCMPGSGSLTRSAINQQAGAETQWSGVISAVAVAVTVLLFGPLAYFIPRSALAGILMLSAWRLVDREQLVWCWRVTRFDRGIVLATAVSAVVVSVEFCILIGVFLSFLLYVPRAARIHLSELIVTPERVIRERLPVDEPCARMLLFALEGEMFFGAAPEVERHLGEIEKRAEVGVRVVVLRLKRARNADATCLGVLAAFLERMNRRHIAVLLCGVREDLAQSFVRARITSRVGRQRVFLETPTVGSSTLDAVRAAYELLAGDVCPSCPRRGEALSGRESWYYMI